MELRQGVGHGNPQDMGTPSLQPASAPAPVPFHFCPRVCSLEGYFVCRVLSDIWNRQRLIYRPPDNFFSNFRPCIGTKHKLAELEHAHRVRLRGPCSGSVREAQEEGQASCPLGCRGALRPLWPVLSLCSQLPRPSLPSLCLDAPRSTLLLDVQYRSPGAASRGEREAAFRLCRGRMRCKETSPGLCPASRPLQVASFSLALCSIWVVAQARSLHRPSSLLLQEELFVLGLLLFSLQRERVRQAKPTLRSWGSQQNPLLPLRPVQGVPSSLAAVRALLASCIRDSHVLAAGSSFACTGQAWGEDWVLWVVPLCHGNCRTQGLRLPQKPSIDICPGRQQVSSGLTDKF